MLGKILYFRHHFPHDWSRPQYKTDDKIIPYRLFNIMMAGARANRVIGKIDQHEASLISNGWFHSKDRDKLQRVVDGWDREANGQL